MRGVHRSMNRMVEFEGRVRVALDPRAAAATPSVEVLYPSAVVVPDDDAVHFSVEGLGDERFRVRLCSPGDAEPAESLDFTGWLDLLGGLEGLIARTLLAGQTDRVHLHGAAALDPAHAAARPSASGSPVDSYGAILGLGPSGAGKSSLALAWSQMGLPLYGDDVLLAGAGGVLEPHRRLLKTDVGRLAEHGIDPRETVAPQDGESEIWFDPATAGGWAGAAAAPGVIARLIRVPGHSGVRVSALSPPEVLQALVASAFPTGVSDPGDMLDVLLPMAEQARGVELTFGSTSTAAFEMVQLLRSR